MPTVDQTNEFSETVTRELSSYVYRLIDPRNGETFYVGKGTGNRVFQHARDQIPDDADEWSDKLERIRDIRNAGLEVQYVIHRHGLTDEMAFEVEAALMDAYPGVTNDQGGHGSGDRGPMHPAEIQRKYDLPAIEDDPKDRLLLININAVANYATAEEVLRQVCCAWRLNVERAKQADYVLAVRKGIVLGAFVADQWLRATSENFPKLANEDLDLPYRWGFKGRPAPDEVWERYVGIRGKRIANKELRHVQNPIRYWNIGGHSRPID